MTVTDCLGIESDPVQAGIWKGIHEDQQSTDAVVSCSIAGHTGGRSDTSQPASAAPPAESVFPGPLSKSDRLDLSFQVLPGGAVSQ